MNADSKPKPQGAYWIEAYKTAHVAAEITDRAANGKLKPDLPRWLLKTARELLKAAKKLNNQEISARRQAAPAGQ